MIDKETAFKKISELVERFGEQIESYKKAGYNETLTRRDFIDPFFKALGWDIDNEQGFAETYREVIHEDKIKIGRATKVPDYSFSVGGGKRLFFVEAKKPSVAIKDEILPAYQVRRYGWNAKLSISIITDFEEFAVYDCTKKPYPSDKASVSRVTYLTFKEYLKEFDFIWNTFSKEHVLKGGFDKYVKETANKKGTDTVDKEFLQSLDNWRTYLATSISLNNKELNEDEINFVVQQTIDRIIFLRIAEDRDVEIYGNLKIALKQGDYYKNLFGIFREADEKYNSGLFDFKKDKISKEIKIDNKVIKTIINELYYPESPYEFSVLPVEILGSAYEQFLGKVIRITPAHHAKIEEKPEVRKAGGVYYTPQYVVEYIVKNTVGKLIDSPFEGGRGMTPKEISNIKIVDPACGSGSFLLGAYQYLLDFHKNYYFKNNKPSKGKKDEPLTPAGNLTTAEKKRILLNNIFGVDIDVNAVEVTKLSLLLKCMEGETGASIETQLSLFHERVLPTLDNNIKCGNSLVDEDIWDGELNLEFNKKIKPFNWQKAFPEVFNRKVVKKEDDLKNIATKVKEHAQKAMEYASELENKLSTLNEPEKNYGWIGGFDCVIGNPPYVQPNLLDTESQKYLFGKYSANTDLYSIFIERSLKILKENYSLGFIIPSLFIKGVRYEKLRDIINKNCLNIEIKEYGDGVFENVKMPTCVITLIKGKSKKTKNFFINNNETIFKKIKTIKLEEISKTRRGLEIGKNKLLGSGNIKCITGSNLDRYCIKVVKFISKETFQIFSKDADIFSSPKIMTRETGNKFFASVDYNNIFTTRSIYNTHIINKKYYPEFILGILNSKLFEFYFKQFISPDTNIFPKIRIAQLKEIPIPVLTNKSQHDEIVKLVDLLLKLNEEKQLTKLQSDIEQIQIRIGYCEDKINEKVYELYNLTEEEIKIINSPYAKII
jgi:type I restriction-modification system DNA methylase subunit